MSEDEKLPPDPVEQKRPSFKEANSPLGFKKPPQGTPYAIITKRKRTVAITLVAVGVGAAALYGVTHHNPACDQYPRDPAIDCSRSGSSGGTYHFSSSSSGSGNSSSDAGTASRGGFGHTGSAHAGGGGE